MIFQYNDIIPQHCVLVKFLNKSSVKNYSENNSSDLMTVIHCTDIIANKELVLMNATEFDYKELYGKINRDEEIVCMPKCRCVACNSCSCGRCEKCISQCTGCVSNDVSIELEWEAV